MFYHYHLYYSSSSLLFISSTLFIVLIVDIKVCELIQNNGTVKVVHTHSGILLFASFSLII